MLYFAAQGIPPGSRAMSVCRHCRFDHAFTGGKCQGPHRGRILAMGVSDDTTPPTPSTLGMHLEAPAPGQRCPLCKERKPKARKPWGAGKDKKG